MPTLEIGDGAARFTVQVETRFMEQFRPGGDRPVGNNLCAARSADGVILPSIPEFCKLGLLSSAKAESAGASPVVVAAIDMLCGGGSVVTGLLQTAGV